MVKKSINIKNTNEIMMILDTYLYYVFYYKILPTHLELGYHF